MIFTKEIDGTHSRPCRSDLAEYNRLGFSAMRGGHFQANKSGGGLHHQVWNILHLNSSRLLIVIIWNRILMSTFIAGSVHPRSRPCRSDLV